MKLKKINGTVSLAAAMSLWLVAAAQAEELVIVATGGGFGDALAKHFYEPFTKETGIEIIKVLAPVGEQNTKLRAMQQSGNVEYDVVTTTTTSVIADADVYAELECSKIPNAVTMGVPGTCGERSLIRTVGAYMVTYNKKSFPGKKPDNWADFWNVGDFPGSRCLIGGSTDNHIPFLIALLADGVAPADLYPIDLDRALAKLNQLKPHIGAYWTSYSQSQQLMRDGECDISVMLNGRAFSLEKEGFPLGVSWNQAITSPAGWGIADGAPNSAAAYKFLNFWMTRPAAHLAFYQTFFYPTANNQVVDMMEGTFREAYYGTPKNLKNQMALNAAWIGDNQELINRTYANFLAQ